MPTLHLIRLKKHFNSNTAGEVVGLTDETAKHVLASQAGDLIGPFDPELHLHVEELDDKGQFVRDTIVDAERDPKTGNMVPAKKKVAPKEEPKK
jgi:hypothetical protein